MSSAYQQQVGTFKSWGPPETCMNQIARDKSPPCSSGSSEELSVGVKFGPMHVNKAIAIWEQINAQPCPVYRVPHKPWCLQAKPHGVMPEKSTQRADLAAQRQLLVIKVYRHLWCLWNLHNLILFLHTFDLGLPFLIPNRNTSSYFEPCQSSLCDSYGDESSRLIRHEVKLEELVWKCCPPSPMHPICSQTLPKGPFSEALFYCICSI